MLNILVVYAVEEERVHLNMENCTFNYCRTGVGKVAAAIAVEKAIAEYNPNLILNIGTAGTLKYEIGSIHICKVFVDRDMEKLQNFGVAYHEDFSNELNQLGLLNNWKFDSTCNTGDTFLTTADGTGDVFDMESFAVARVCKSHQLPFVGIKCVTDIIGQNSIQHWEDKLAEAQATLQNYVTQNPILVPDLFISLQAKALIKKYDLQEHPEGGWYKEVYRSEMLLKADGIPMEFGADRNALTSIHYMLESNRFSAFHCIKSPEVWYFHHGQPLLIHMINNSGDYSCVELSDRDNGILQFTVNPGTWFAASIKNSFGYTLVSCAVAPGFDFNDFEMAKASELLKLSPNNETIINKLCNKL